MAEEEDRNRETKLGEIGEHGGHEDTAGRMAPLPQARAHGHIHDEQLLLYVTLNRHDRHTLPDREYLSSVEAAADLGESNVVHFELDAPDMAGRKVVLNHTPVVASAEPMADRLGDHSQGDSWKQRAVQGRGDVCHGEHERHDLKANVMLEADNRLQEHATRRTKLDDVRDMVGQHIRTEPGEDHDDLENGDTGRRDPENLEIPHLLCFVLDGDMKRPDASSQNLAAVEEAADHSHSQTWRLREAAAACGAITEHLSVYQITEGPSTTFVSYVFKQPLGADEVRGDDRSRDKKYATAKTGYNPNKDSMDENQERKYRLEEEKLEK